MCQLARPLELWCHRALGVTNNTSVSVLDLLPAVAARSRNGVQVDRGGNGVINVTESGLRGTASDLFGVFNALGGM